MGVEPLTMSPEELDARVVNEITLNGALVKAIGLKSN
jgi:hypothetical protein